jgi:hypothetical protein
MGSLPRPLLAVLVAVIAVFAAWTFVLKPKSSSTSGGASPQAVHQALSTAVGSTGSAKHTTTSKSASTSASAHPAAPAAPSHVSPAQRRVNEVTSALESGKVLALLFYNPAAPDDQADVKAVLAIPSHHGEVARVAIPVSEISRYTEIVDHVPVQSTPTLLVIDQKHRAQMLIGFADQLEYNQLVAGALKTR